MMPKSEWNVVVDTAPEDRGAEPVPLSPQAPEKEVYVFPASQEQSRYWILNQLDGASTASNMAIAFRLQGEVADHLVERALTALTLRHEALRTTYRMVDGELSQVISEEAGYSFRVSDLRDVAAGKRAEEAEALIAATGEVHIDLAQGPVLFAHLIHLTDRDHLLAFTIHHIACDGWSNGILVRDFAEFYAAYSEGRAPQLPELPFQFADFTVWQQQWLESDAARSALTFWKEHVRRDMPAVDLPTDRPRSAQKSAPGHIESLLLSPALDARLKAYCRQQNVTMHQVLLAAFEGLMARYTHQPEFLLGSTIANRTQPGMENVVGRFAHPQVLLADVRGNPTYRELLTRVSEWSTRAYSHQDLPFSRLMEEFQIDQVGATSQFLQVYFVYQKAFMQPQENGALKIIPRPSVSGGVNFDMLVSIVDRAEGPRLQIEYNTILFTQKRVQRLVEMYARVLEAVMDNDALAVSDLPLLYAQEERDLAASASSQVLAPKTSGSIAEWFDGQADALLDSDAVVVGNSRLSWRDLQGKSRRYAMALSKLGVQPGSTVALRMEGTGNAAATAIALLRLGAVVLPVPMGTMESEMDLIQAELKPEMILVDDRSARGKDAGAANIVSLSHIDFLSSAAVSGESVSYPDARQAAWLGVRVEEGHLKTVAGSHEATLAAMAATAEALKMRRGDSVLVFPAPSSTDGWLDFMVPLLAGATIIYAGDEIQSGQGALKVLTDLAERMPRASTRFAFATGAEWLSLLKGAGDKASGLQVVVRGAQVSPATIRTIAAASADAWLLATSPWLPGPFGVARLNASDEAGRYGQQNLPLSPLPGEHFLLGDERGHAVPFGVQGELVVQRKSAACPTGWIATYTPESGFRLIGAAQRTVNLHSYRLRLGEVEDLLAEHPQVAAAAAALSPREDGSMTLVAYLSAPEGTALPLQDVAAFLRSRAPAYLASTELVPVQGLVRRIDGSVDASFQRRLDEGQIAPQTGAIEYVGARDELEEKLVAIWEAVIGVKGIGVRTSFFSLGGYSLMIVRLFARINKSMNTSLPITTIFNAPTIEQLADILRGRTIYSSLVPIQTKGTKLPLFLIHSYLLYDGLRSVLGDDQPFYGLRELDRDQTMNLDQRVSSYVNEIRRIQPHGPYYIGGWCAAGPLAVSTAKQLTEAGEKVDLLVLFDSWRPGYAAELASTQADNPEMNIRARLRRKWLFHRKRLKQMSVGQRLGYFDAAILHKLRTMRSHFYIRNWGLAQKLFERFNLPLPDFMHNVSLTTMHAVKLYRGSPFPGRITLIRATEVHYIPGADSSCGWDSLAQDGVRVLWAPGDHESMFVEPNLAVLGGLLNGVLSNPHVNE